MIDCVVFLTKNTRIHVGFLTKKFDSFIELNLELSQETRNLFKSDLDPKRIITEIGYLTRLR